MTYFLGFRRLFALSLGALALGGALRSESPPTVGVARSFKLDLTPATFPALHALVRPHENEWRHLKVDWFTDVVAARKKAVAEDKPIVICYTGGAGYNEPLGVC